MKALEFLKNLKDQNIVVGDSTYCFKFYDEAIAELEQKLLKEQKTCRKCIHAIHCEETDEYSYNHKNQNCKDCYRSGWTDNYKENTQIKD